MIDVNAIVFSHSPRAPRLFDGFCWKVAKGERWAVIGPSGCGKTTLLLLLAGLLRPQGGEVRVRGEPLVRPSGLTGLVLQDYELLPWANVLANVTLGLRLAARRGAGGAADPRQKAMQWLDRLGIADLAARFPHELSGGQRQRTAIARTLALDPDVLLMDEPFSALDVRTREGLQDLTVAMCASAGITLVLVTHQVEEACMVGERVLALGPAPVQAARVIENRHAPDAEWRRSAGFVRACEALRAASGGGA